MILEFNERQYINVEQIDALRWFAPKDGNNGYGIVVIRGQKITVKIEEFDVIEKAYLWYNGYSLYDKNLKKKGGK